LHHTPTTINNITTKKSLVNQNICQIQQTEQGREVSLPCLFLPVVYIRSLCFTSIVCVIAHIGCGKIAENRGKIAEKSAEKM